MDILSPEQSLLWNKLRPVSSLGFVLYGGTAVALRLGHRVSVDFVFFSDQKFDREILYATFPLLLHSTVLQDEQNALSVLVVSEQKNKPVKLSFFGTITLGRIGDPEITDDGVLQVASLDDLMATKVKVILQRAEAKDYQDIAGMIRARTSLSRGLAAARLFYGIKFQPSESLKALTYFKDGDLHTLNDDDKETLVTAASEVRHLPQVRLISKRLVLPSHH